MKSGKDTLHKRKDTARQAKQALTNTHEANVIHYTYLVSHASTRKVKTEAEDKKETRPQRHEERRCMNLMCGFPARGSDRFCSTFSTRIPGDERTSPDKRGWSLVSDDEGPETVERPKTYSIKKSTMKEAAGAGKKGGTAEGAEEMLELSALEVIAALPTRSKSEKRALKCFLLKEEEKMAWETCRKHRGEDEVRIGHDEKGRPSGATGSGGYSEQLPVPPKKAESVKDAFETLEQGKKKDAPRKVKERMLHDLAQFVPEPTGWKPAHSITMLTPPQSRANTMPPLLQ